MAAVLGMSREDLEQVCRESTAETTVVVANDNCPGQLVISGDLDAVQRATALASERGAKRVLPLNVAGAFHSPLMNDSASAMGEALRLVTFHHGEAPVYANVTAGPVATPDAWPSLLESQLSSPVRWTESVQSMVADGVRLFLECGSGEVLSGLVKRTDKSVRAMPVVDSVTMETARAALAEEVLA
jgi:[acyl-carrier-protein] S-malonyltransferase